MNIKTKPTKNIPKTIGNSTTFAIFSIIAENEGLEPSQLFIVSPVFETGALH
jgi:hypothetical protein